MKVRSKVVRLLDRIIGEVSGWNDAKSIKTRINNSINNNRTLSVRQTINFLQDSVFFDNRQLGYDLENVYEILLQKKLLKKVRRNNNRTDAFDLNELTVVVDKFVTPALKSTLGRNISSF